ncbi:MAG: alpha/beta hydrolase [Gammaproteobacteria bacterium]|nr:alpha/beta hydrolase [Gammaproteobacteria bacterium]
MTSSSTLQWTRREVKAGDVLLEVLTAGEGPPLLVLHEELGSPGPLQWQINMARQRTLLIPQHPGFSRTPRQEWIASLRDLACLYGIYLRGQRLHPIDVIGFSFGGWLAAEMIANDPSLFSSMTLVGPVGIKPPSGEILDLFMLTTDAYLRASVRDVGATVEFNTLYGAEQTPELFEAFEDARAETARLAWRPYMYNPSLPHLLQAAAKVPTLLLWGADDAVVPVSAATAYQAALPHATLKIFANCGHRPEIEQRAAFETALNTFLKRGEA